MKHFILLLLLSVGTSLSASYAQKTAKLDQLLFSEQYLEAIPLLEQLIKKDSTNSLLYFQLGKLYQKLDKDLLATYNYRKANTLQPNSETTLLSLSSSLYALGNYPDAEKHLSNLYAIDSTNYSINLLFAKTLASQNKLQESLDLYQQIIEVDSLNPGIHKQIGSLKDRMQDFNGSLSSYMISYELNTSDLSVLVHIIQQLYEMTGYQQALEYCSKGLVTYPNNSVLLKKKAQVLIGLEWYDNALNILKDLEGSKQLSEAEHKYLGICYMQTRQYEEALTAFAACGPNFEKDPMINFHTGICYARLNQHQKAITYLENALFYITPSIEASMHLYLAKSYHANQQFEKAITSYQHHFEMDNTNADILYEIATSYEEYGNNKDKALDYYSKYLQQSNNKEDPKYEYAKSRILRIKENIHFEK
ncbi:hypothetical protein BZG02_15795 [Labilibaculum filiforme]|uniref:Uncharacterized protein n=1 Tax=Labilibaculum filiforme TaxID=1940526 RepID=A0A2N3HTM5_9BACT|nr:tetratricopeptide repeat protein [Labilibaculum filiforme]PKQ61415.1 hypothetical protein BZG02_15795 [Labilibaculum filiforme]